MKFEYIILLILAFNVVTALVKKRKARAESGEAKPKVPRVEVPVDARNEMGRSRDAYAPGNGPGHRDERDRARDGEDLEAPAPASAQGRKGGMGRDLLEHLAKEFGIETSPEPSRPEASPYRVERRETVAPEVVAVVPPSTKRAPRRVTAPVPAPTPAVPPSATPGRASALELRDAEALRRAFIAKEILGPPVSRGRGRG